MTDSVLTEIHTANINSIVVECVDMSFSSVVENLLVNVNMKDNMVKLKIVLSDELISILKKILSKTPNWFNETEKIISEIIIDDKIDSNDLPKLIDVIQKIYHIIYDLKTEPKIRSNATAQVIKFVMHLFIIERMDIEEDKKNMLLVNCDSLIDACVRLISFPKEIKTKKCFKKLFS